jgi:SNF2 family DNA or RNA helicase
VGGETLTVPATVEVLSALQRLEAERARVEDTPETWPPPRNVDVLIIRPNEDEVDLEGEFAPRPTPAGASPACLATTLKAHQEEGLAWLRSAYAMGRPGVLLADDMGLGKTLQGLAFLAWLREGMATGKVTRAPVAVVAPTGLLQNWMAEEARHLARPGLGRCLEAFGSGLAALKRPGADGRPTLDLAKIEQADWVLTTYETLRDFDRDFGSVRFAAMLLDEAQKIKTPGIRITDAAKAMNVDFRVALTGTPVENRLADLWCITDAIHPAFLGDLKTFSADYERSPDPERLRRLKRSLDAAHGGRAPILLRRLKRDRLPDLPAPNEIAASTNMPPLQRDAYEATLDEVRSARAEPGAVLSALQRLKAISLHPDPQMSGDDEAFMAASARCRLAVEALDHVAERGERALVFVDDLAFQARLAGILQRRYGLKSPPAIISGSVSGQARQTRVDRFQTDPTGFDVMILSPRAGGVGLTLTAANHVIHLTRWWNPAVEDQCTGRVLRIGQTRPVNVHLPMAVLADERPSFDCNLDALIRRKRQLFQDAFMPPEATEGERDELFRNTIGI